jgi:5-methyltetrahydropteroyltriglutamate--homocysteine methyltransferase
LCDPAIREKVEAAGEKPDALVDLYIESINDAVAAVPNGVAVGIHVCRGNFKGHYLASGGYESVAEQFFSRTKATHFLLEYDTERAGDFRPLRFVEDKGVVLGLISSKLRRSSRVRRWSGACAGLAISGTQQLAISPQCGFASTAAGNPMTEADERAKLKLVTETAAAIWGRGEIADPAGSAEQLNVACRSSTRHFVVADSERQHAAAVALEGGAGA